MIDGVKIRQLKPHCDERGRVMELMRSDWPEFIRFGQVYMTTAYPGAIKAWHYHKKQTDSLVCVQGMAKLVLYDARPGSPTKGELMELFFGEHNLVMVQVPPEVYHGFKGIDTVESLILNAPTGVYNYAEPDEYRLPPDTKDIPYSWERKDG